MVRKTGSDKGSVTTFWDRPRSIRRDSTLTPMPYSTMERMARSSHEVKCGFCRTPHRSRNSKSSSSDSDAGESSGSSARRSTGNTSALANSWSRGSTARNSSSSKARTTSRASVRNGNITKPQSTVPAAIHSSISV